MLVASAGCHSQPRLLGNFFATQDGQAHHLIGFCLCSKHVWRIPPVVTRIESMPIMLIIDLHAATLIGLG